MPPTRIQWPEGIDETRFLTQYWQRKPLLIRQALPHFDTPLPADELAGLSLEPETTPRLILRDDQGRYALEHGPFDAERFSSLSGNDWSLLVTDVEKHLPALADWLQPFRFLPDWRIDDLMVSYAPVGASVGAHTDEYDVFLLQASGAREWSIDASAPASPRLQADSDLRLLADFRASDTWILQPGDLLYLPPGVPHHGIACEEPCTTWSIGFRAPSQADLAMRISEMICESLPHQRYRDELQQPARPGEIDARSLTGLMDFWQKAMTPDRDSLASLLACFLTEAVGSDLHTAADWPSRVDGEVETAGLWRRDPFSRIAWYIAEHTPDEGDDTRVHLFVDGIAYRCRRALAMTLSAPNAVVSLPDDTLTQEEQELMTSLMETGALMQDD